MLLIECITDIAISLDFFDFFLVAANNESSKQRFTLRMSCGRTQDLINCYGISVSDYPDMFRLL
jgi:hypothetical protein